jgi:hypothetical protein
MRLTAILLSILAAMALWLAPAVPAGEDPAAAFAALCAKRAADAKTMTVPGREGWLFLAGELRHLGVGPFWGEAAAKTSQAAREDCKDPLPAIVDFKDQLEKLGIELILVIVPPKATVYPDMLDAGIKVEAGKAPPRLDAQLQAFAAELKAKGVKTVDLWPELAAGRAAPAAPMYCRTDTHWSGMACVRAAKLVAKELAGRDWIKEKKTEKFETEEREVKVRGDLIEALPEKERPEPEKLRLRFVGRRAAGGGVLQPVLDDRASPVLLLADSHGLVFHIGEELFAKGAGLADQMAAELGFPVEVLATRGSASTKVRIDIYQRAKADRQWLAGKKAVVWCFTARELTESLDGWRKVPVVRK